MRVGHRGDINSIACQQNYIISGGHDGLLGVWNQFSGVLKYAIKLPDAVDINKPMAKERMKNATNTAIRENENPTDYEAKASNQIMRTIVAVMFHPYWRNVALVLQEGGNVHAVDVSNGMIVNDFIAMVQTNSCWAIDPTTYHMMVVGDQGMAILFDARMGAAIKNKENKKKLRFWEMQEPQNKIVQTKRVPIYKAQIDPKTNELEKWKVIKTWFRAHDLNKTQPHFVNIVRFSKVMKVFITSTNFGEVKLWDQNLQCYGVLNLEHQHPNDDRKPFEV